MNATNPNECAVPRLLSIADVARIYRIPRTLQWQLRKSGALCYRQHPGNSRIFYLAEDVETYVASIGKVA